jgi:hypothetical protein
VPVVTPAAMAARAVMIAVVRSEMPHSKHLKFLLFRIEIYL